MPVEPVNDVGDRLSVVDVYYSSVEIALPAVRVDREAVLAEASCEPRMEFIKRASNAVLRDSELDRDPEAPTVSHRGRG